MIQNVFFDCDSTLVSTEGINELAKMKGRFEEVADLTQQAMDGKIALHEVFKKRLEIIRPSRQDLLSLGQIYIQNLTPGAREVISQLESQGKTVFIISGGYKLALDVLGGSLEIPARRIFGVEIDFDQSGNYLGYDDSQVLTTNSGKKEVISKMDLDLQSTAMVGDGANDLSVREVVGLFIGFQGARENQFMRQNADVFVEGNDLSQVVEIIDRVS